MQPKILVIIPAFNEEDSIQRVIQDIPKNLINEIVVVNNNSSDNTKKAAKDAGATVLTEQKQGYGYSCLKGIEYASNKNEEQKPDIIVFLDGDYSDYPGEVKQLVQPIVENNYDLVIGSRHLGNKEKGAMLPQAIFGNWLATTLLRWIYNIRFTDLGPFRAIKFDKLLSLYMQDKTYGWTVEMQLKAAKHKLKCCEIPVSYRKRIGISKITGTVSGTIKAGYKILYTIFKYM